MYLCYVDESGTPEVPGTTSHFVLAGVSIPIWHWRDADREVSSVLNRYGLASEELHTAWLLRKYLEQSRIPGFETMSWDRRRAEVERYRNGQLLALQQANKHKAYKQAKKNYKSTSGYVHLTYNERKKVVLEIAKTAANWGFARLFAECIDKLYFDPAKTGKTIGEQAFEQILSRFETYLQKIDKSDKPSIFGLLIHDNNQTVAKRHTDQMREYQRQGTLWTKVDRTIETPLFVDSSLTRMVQIADLCSYALRRYVENGDAELFREVFSRADRRNETVVGVRHYTNLSCSCEICQAHRPTNG